MNTYFVDVNLDVKYSFKKKTCQKSICIQRTVLLTTLLSLCMSGCNSAGIAHRVPESAVARVTGQDKLKLDAAKVKIQEAKEKNSSVRTEKQQAQQAVATASKGVDEARRELIEHDKKRKILAAKKAKAERYRNFREGQVKLFALKKKLAEAEEQLRFAEYEMLKFQLVGRIESGSEKNFKMRMGDFRAQLQNAKMTVAAARQEWAQASKRVRQQGQEFRRSQK